MTITRRDLLKITAMAFVADFQVKLMETEPERPFFGICAWARGVKEAIDAKKFTLKELMDALSDVITPGELGKRLRLTKLPRWCQDEVDAGLMPLARACTVAQADCPEALWVKAKTLPVGELYKEIRKQRIMG